MSSFGSNYGTVGTDRTSEQHQHRASDDVRTSSGDRDNWNNNATPRPQADSTLDATLSADIAAILRDSDEPDLSRRHTNMRRQLRNNSTSINSDLINTGDNPDADETTALLGAASLSPSSFPALKIYRRRWYMLALFSLMSFTQGGLMGVWAVIAKSVEAAFNWKDGDISLLQSWAYTTYVISMFPFAFLIDKKGLRPAVLVTAAFLVAGSSLRCVTTREPYVTRLAHIGNILIGFAGPVAFTCGPIISARWFPPHQRATATAVATIAGFTGSAGCFLFGPLMVEAPKSLDISEDPPHYINIDKIKHEIMFCRYVECGLCSAIFLATLIYFPSNPPSAPSLTAALGRVQFTSGLRDLFRRENVNFWLICISYCTSVSIYGVWNNLFGINLKDTVTTSDIGWLGFSSVMAGSAAAVTFGRISDLFVGHMKTIVLVLNVGCMLSTFWFILIAQSVIPFSRVQLFAAAIIQGLCNNGAIPLYYELAIETTYPITEVCISTIMTAVYNVLPIIFLVVFVIPDVGTRWMNWVLYGSLIIVFPILLNVKERYKRSMVDRGEAPVPKDLQSSVEASSSPSDV